MTKKYIVKNCPAYNPKYCDCKNTKEIACLYRTDCLIKQVVEKCKQELYNEESWYHRKIMAEELLQLFTIEEVE